MALEPTLDDYAVVDPKAAGDRRPGTKPYIALKVGGRFVRQFTADTPDAAALFKGALEKAQAALAWEAPSSKASATG
jgi:hypothetical protein